MPALKLSWLILDLSIYLRLGSPLQAPMVPSGVPWRSMTRMWSAPGFSRWKWAHDVRVHMDLIPWRIPGYNMAILYKEHGKWWENGDFLASNFGVPYGTLVSDKSIDEILQAGEVCRGLRSRYHTTLVVTPLHLIQPAFTSPTTYSSSCLFVVPLWNKSGSSLIHQNLHPIRMSKAGSLYIDI